MPPEETIVEESAAPVAETKESRKGRGKSSAAPVAETKDERSAEEKALTSHLDNFKIGAESEGEESGEDSETAKLKLPTDPAKVLELLQKVSAETVTTKAQAKSKQDKLNQIRDHLHKIQQGPQAPSLDHKSHATHAAATTDHAKEFKLIMLAREHVEVRELIDERDALLEQISELTKK